MVLVVLVLAATAMLAAMALSRITDRDKDRTTTMAALQRAADALDQFAANQHRLPCPADPTLDTGVEAITAVGASTCLAAAAQGTLPWNTLGLTHDQGLDAWGDKISYRVYAAGGAAGSLVQPEGLSMVQCDVSNAPLTGVDESVDPATGLCRSNADPFQRSTTPDNFYKNMSNTYQPLKVLEYSQSFGGAATNTPLNVAYVLISHGPTGYGAYTVSGVRKSYSDVAGDELANTSAAGPFAVRPFSDVDVEANSNKHFDDLLLYRTLPELASKTGLAARDWPEFAGATFTSSAIASAMGVASVSPGNLGTSSINFGTLTATASSGNLSLVSDPTSGEGLGTGGGFGGYINSIDNLSIAFRLNYSATKFALTLGNFGTYSFFASTYAERAQLVFKDASGTVLATVTDKGCRADGGLASFTTTIIPDPPVVSTSQSNSGGTLAAGTNYTYRVTAYNSVGESLPGAETTQKTTNGGGDNHKITLTWPASTGATGYKVYGRTSGAEQLMADVGNVLTFTDTNAITPSGAMPTNVGFTTVEVHPMTAIDGSGNAWWSFFFLSEVKACTSSTPTCTTALAAPSNNCP